MGKKYTLVKGDRTYTTDLVSEKVNLLADGWRLAPETKKTVPANNKARTTARNK